MEEEQEVLGKLKKLGFKGQSSVSKISEFGPQDAMKAFSFLLELYDPNLGFAAEQATAPKQLAQ